MLRRAEGRRREEEWAAARAHSYLVDLVVGPARPTLFSAAAEVFRTDVRQARRLLFAQLRCHALRAVDRGCRSDAHGGVATEPNAAAIPAEARGVAAPAGAQGWRRARALAAMLPLMRSGLEVLTSVVAIFSSFSVKYLLNRV